MEKTYFTGGINVLNDPIYGVLRQLQDKQNEVIDYLTLLDKLAIRVARLEVYYKQHRKEHLKK